ncbi:MAG: hypothetical protein HQK57_16500 [Deltaproteobacteria bacterium]|nr:hypothetical protein [Deltaproteobacteria bacterium]
MVEIIRKGKTPLKPPKDLLPKEPEPVKAAKKVKTKATEPPPAKPVETAKEPMAPAAVKPAQEVKPPTVEQLAKTGPPETASMKVIKDPGLPWDEWINQRMTFQARTGVVYTGIVKEYRKGWILLDEAVIIGKSFGVQPKYVWVERNQFIHAHPDCEVQRVEALVEKLKTCA